MKTAKLAAACFMLLAGCSSAPTEGVATQTHLPDGRAGHSIRCSGSMSGCYERAGETCKGQGYEVVSQQQSKAGAFGFTGIKYQDVYDVLIACKK